MSTKFVFGAVNDTDKSLQSKAGGKFGMNHGNIVKLQFNPNCGANGTPGNGFDCVIKIGDREFNRRLFEPTGDLYYKGNKISPSDENYATAFSSEMTQITATITHMVKATGVTQEQINAKFATAVGSFQEWCNAMVSLVPANYTSLPVDVFLHWQWDVKGDNDRKYLEVPGNMKSGYFLCASPTPVGGWSEDKSDGLKYIDKAGTIHPFVKSANYMDSNRAKEDNEATANALTSLANSSTTSWD